MRRIWRSILLHAPFQIVSGLHSYLVTKCCSYAIVMVIVLIPTLSGGHLF